MIYVKNEISCMESFREAVVVGRGLTSLPEFESIHINHKMSWMREHGGGFMQCCRERLGEVHICSVHPIDLSSHQALFLIFQKT